MNTEQRMLALSSMLNHLMIENEEDENNVSIIMPDVNHHDLHTQRPIFSKFCLEILYLSVKIQVI